MSIREYQSEDLSAIMAIELDAGVACWGEDYERQMAKRADFVIFISTENEIVTGFLAGFINDKGFHIVNVATHSTYRRRGFGEKLLRHCIQYTTIMGLGQVVLEVRNTNYVAQTLYRKLGFRYAGRRHNYYDGPKEDALVMELRL